MGSWRATPDSQPPSPSTLSERKGLLGFVALVTAIALLVDLALWLRLHAGRTPTLSDQSTALWMMGIMFVQWVTVCWLMVEEDRARRESGVEPPDEDSADLDHPQIKALFGRCPSLITWTCGILGAIALVDSFRYDNICIQFGREMTGRELLSFVSPGLIFLCLGLPILVSATLMDGGYEDQAD